MLVCCMPMGFDYQRSSYRNPVLVLSVIFIPILVRKGAQDKLSDKLSDFHQQTMPHMEPVRVCNQIISFFNQSVTAKLLFTNVSIHIVTTYTEHTLAGVSRRPKKSFGRQSPNRGFLGSQRTTRSPFRPPPTLSQKTSNEDHPKTELRKKDFILLSFPIANRERNSK